MALFILSFFAVRQVSAAVWYDTLTGNSPTWTAGEDNSNLTLIEFEAVNTNLNDFSFSLKNHNDPAGTPYIVNIYDSVDAAAAYWDNIRGWGAGQSTLWSATVYVGAADEVRTYDLDPNLDVTAGTTYYIGIFRYIWSSTTTAYFQNVSATSTGICKRTIGYTTIGPCSITDTTGIRINGDVHTNEPTAEVISPDFPDSRISVGSWELSFPSRLECLIASGSACHITVSYSFDDIGKTLGLYPETATTTNQWVDQIPALPDQYLLRADLHPVTRSAPTIDTYQYLISDGVTSTPDKSYGYTKVFWVTSLTGGEEGGYSNLWDYFTNIFPLSIYYDLKSVTAHYDTATGSAITLNLNDVLVLPGFTADAELLSVAKFRYALGEELYGKWMLYWEYIIHGAAFIILLMILWPETMLLTLPGRTHAVSAPPGPEYQIDLRNTPRYKNGTEVIDLRRK